MKNKSLPEFKTLQLLWFLDARRIVRTSLYIFCNLKLQGVELEWTQRYSKSCDMLLNSFYDHYLLDYLSTSIILVWILSNYAIIINFVISFGKISIKNYDFSVKFQDWLTRPFKFILFACYFSAHKNGVRKSIAMCQNFRHFRNDQYKFEDTKKGENTFQNHYL